MRPGCGVERNRDVLLADLLRRAEIWRETTGSVHDGKASERRWIPLGVLHKDSVISDHKEIISKTKTAEMKKLTRKIERSNQDPRREMV